MRTVEVTESAVSIWLSSEGVPERRQMLAMVKKALRDSGYTPWPETEAECFTAGNDALVIARPAAPHRKAFFFSELESLIGGARTCPEAESSLYAFGNGYILFVAPDASILGLYEYGEPAELDPDWELHAAEQDVRLLADTATADLVRFFAT